MGGQTPIAFKIHSLVNKTTHMASSCLNKLQSGFHGGLTAVVDYTPLYIMVLLLYNGKAQTHHEKYAWNVRAVLAHGKPKPIMGSMLGMSVLVLPHENPSPLWEACLECQCTLCKGSYINMLTEHIVWAYWD